MQMVIQSAGMTVLEEKSFDRLLATNSLRTQGQWVVTLCGVTVECTWAAGSGKTCLRSAPCHHPGQSSPSVGGTTEAQRGEVTFPELHRELQPEPGLAAGCHGQRNPEFDVRRLEYEPWLLEPQF